MSLGRGTVLTLVLATSAAALGAWGGSQFALAHLRDTPSLHDILHTQLHLTPDQRKSIEGLERDHAARRAALEAQMRAANADLARAYQENPAYTPRVQAAIDKLHVAMAALQKETMLHVIAMRRGLTPKQAARFDATVVRSLTAENP